MILNKARTIKRKLALFIAIVMLFSNMTFAEEGSSKSTQANLEEISSDYFEQYTTENLTAIYDAVGQGNGEDCENAFEVINDSSIEIQYSAIASKETGEGSFSTGEDIIFEANVVRNTSTGVFEGVYLIFTLPAELGEISVPDSGTEYKLGTMNGVKVIAFNLGKLDAGISKIQWGSSFPAETTPADAEAKTNAFLMFEYNTPEEVMSNMGLMKVDGNIIILGEALKVYPEISQNMIIEKIVLPIHSDDEQEPKRFYEKVEFAGRTYYKVDYEINIRRDKPFLDIGTAAIDKFELLDTIPKSPKGRDAVLIMNSTGGRISEGDVMVWNFEGDDFGVDDLNRYSLKNPVKISLYYLAVDFLPESENATVENIATGKYKAIGQSDESQAVKSTAAYTAEPFAHSYKMKISKTTAKESENIKWSEPLKKDLQLEFDIVIENAGSGIIDKFEIAESSFCFNDNGEAIAVSQEDYTLEIILPERYEGCQGLDKYINDKGFPVIIGEKLEPGAKIEGITALVTLKKATDTAIAQYDNFTNTITGDFEYTEKGETKEGKQITSQAHSQVEYIKFGEAKFSKTFSEKSISAKDFSEDKDISFTLKYENTTGYPLDKITISDLGINAKPDSYDFSNISVYKGEVKDDNLLKEKTDYEIFKNQAEGNFHIEIQDIEADSVYLATAELSLLQPHWSDTNIVDEIINNAEAYYVYGEKTSEKLASSDSVFISKKESLKLEIGVAEFGGLNKLIPGYITEEDVGIGGLSSIPRLAQGDSVDGLLVKEQEIVYLYRITNTGDIAINSFKIDNINGVYNDKRVGTYVNTKDNTDINDYDPGVYSTEAYGTSKISFTSYSLQKDFTNPLTITQADAGGFEIDFDFAPIKPGQFMDIYVKGKVNALTSSEDSISRLFNTALIEYGDKKELSKNIAKNQWNHAVTVFENINITSDIEKAAEYNKSINSYEIKEILYTIDAWVKTDVNLKAVTITDTGPKLEVDGKGIGVDPFKYFAFDKIFIPVGLTEIAPDILENIQVNIQASAQEEKWVLLEAKPAETTRQISGIDVSGYELDINGMNIKKIKIVIPNVKASDQKYEFHNIQITGKLDNLWELITDTGKNVSFINCAQLGWAVEGAEGITGHTPNITGEAITILKPKPVVSVKKTVSPNSNINFVDIRDTGKTLTYTIDVVNSSQGKSNGMSVGKLSVNDNGLYFIDAKNKQLSDVDYTITSIKIQTFGKVAEEMLGKINYEYISDTKQKIEGVINNNEHIIDTNAKAFNISFTAQEGNLPVGFGMRIVMSVKLNPDSDLKEIVKSINNKAEAMIYRSAADEEASIAKASTAISSKIAYKPSAIVTKLGAIGLTKDIYSLEPYAYKSNEEAVKINLADIVSQKGANISYKVTVKNNSPHKADIAVKDNTTITYNANAPLSDKNKFKIQAFYIPAAYAEGVRKQSNLGFIETTSDISGYTKFAATGNRDSADFKLKNMPAGAEVDLYFDLCLIDSYDERNPLTEICNTASATASVDGIVTATSTSHSHKNTVEINTPYIDFNLNKDTHNKAVNLNELLKGDVVIGYTIKGIGHGEKSDAHLKDYNLSDSFSIYNYLTKTSYDLEQAKPYAWISKITFKAHEVDGLFPDIIINYKDSDYDKFKWESGKDTVIVPRAGEKIISFSVNEASLPIGFANENIEAEITLAKATATEFYGYTDGSHPSGENEKNIFSITNSITQSANRPYSKKVNDKISITKDVQTKIVSSKKPTMVIKKSSDVSALYITNMYLGKQEIKYSITGIANNSDQPVTDLTVTDSGPVFKDKSGNPMDSIAYKIKDVKIIYSANVNSKIKGEEVPGAVFVKNTDNGGFTINIKEMPAEDKYEIVYTLAFDLSGQYDIISQLGDLNNDANIKYNMYGKEISSHDVSCVINAKAGISNLSITKALDSENKKPYPGGGVQWSIDIHNTKRDYRDVKSAVIEPVIEDILPAIFNNAADIKKFSATLYSANAYEPPVDVKDKISYEIGAVPPYCVKWHYHGALKELQYLRIRINTSISADAEIGSYVNKAQVYEYYNPDGARLKDSASVKIVSPSTTAMKKEAAGDVSDAMANIAKGEHNFISYSNMAISSPGSKGFYRITFSNFSMSKLGDSVVIADHIPTVSNGTDVSFKGYARKSSWAPTYLNEGFESIKVCPYEESDIKAYDLVNGVDYKIYFSEYSGVDIKAVVENAMQNSRINMAADGIPIPIKGEWVEWNKTLDLSKYKSFVICFRNDYRLEAKAKLVLDYAVQIPGEFDNYSYGQSLVRNLAEASAAYYNEGYLVIPNKVRHAVALNEIGDYVWADKNANGYQEGNEKGIENVEVALFSADKGEYEFVKSTRTDGTGKYRFDQISSGQYKVGFVLPNPKFYGFTVHKAENPEINSDVDTGEFISYDGKDYFLSGEIGFKEDESKSLMDIDAGIVQKDKAVAKIGDYVWIDDNGNGLQDTEEKPFQGLKIILFKKVNHLWVNIQSKVTDINGKYLFEGKFESGIYAVGFSKADDYKFTIHNSSDTNKGRNSNVSDNAEIVSVDGKDYYLSREFAINELISFEDISFDLGLVKLSSPSTRKDDEQKGKEIKPSEKPKPVTPKPEESAPKAEIIPEDTVAPNEKAASREEINQNERQEETIPSENETTVESQGENTPRYTFEYDSDTGLYMVFDESGVPLGYSKSPDSFILEDIIPLGDIKINPITSGSAKKQDVLAAASLTIIGALFYILKKQRKNLV